MNIELIRNADPVAYVARDTAGSVFELRKIAEGTVKVQTSGEQRLIVDHTPYYVDAIVTVRANPDNDEAPIADTRVGQIAYRYTGKDQTAPTAERQAEVCEKLAAAVRRIAAESDLLGLLEHGDAAFRSAAQKHFAANAEHWQDQVQQASEQIGAAESKLETARARFALAIHKRAEAETLAGVAKRQLDTVSPAGRCIVSHGSVIAVADGSEWRLDGDWFRPASAPGSTGMVVEQLKERYPAFTGCENSDAHSVADFTQGLQARGQWLFDF